MFTADISIRSSNGSNIAACNKTDYVVIQIAGDVYISKIRNRTHLTWVWHFAEGSNQVAW